MAGKQNFTIEKGASFERRLTWRNKLKRPINLTGFTAKLQVRSVPGDPNVLLELSTENGGIALGGATGTIDLFLDFTSTQLLSFTNGYFDLLLIPPGGTGRAYRMVEGKILVSQNITVA